MAKLLNTEKSPVERPAIIVEGGGNGYIILKLKPKNKSPRRAIKVVRKVS